MKPRNVIMWALLPVILVLVLFTGVQAQELTEVPASYILEQIQSGEDVLFDHIYVTGALDLSKIELEPVFIVRTGHQRFYGLKEELKPIESPITITNSVFENDINFQNAWFRNPIIFRGSTLSREVNFRGAIFDYYVLFNDVRFDDDACFDRVTFGGSADFTNANFDADIGFQNALFKRDADFYNATFDGVTDFTFATFSDYTCFNYANFGSAAEFKSANFIERASFMCATFSDDAEFTSAEFDEVDFSNTTFSQHFLIHDADFKRIKVSWSSLKDALVIDGPTYVKLIKNFRELEQFEDADDAYYQYRFESTKQKEWSLSKLGDVSMQFLCGYGVKPQLAIVWGVFVILVFTLIYWLRNGIRRLKDEDEDNRVSFGDALYFSMVTFTTVGYGDWYPTDKYRKFVMIEGLLGWLLLALFLVTLANVMIRP